VPLILGDRIQSLCDANYVNSAAITTWDGGLEVRIYPSGTSQFTVFDGTQIVSVAGAGSTNVTIASLTPRPVLLQIHASRPAAVRRDGTLVPEAPGTAAFEAASQAWQFDAIPSLIAVKFPHPGGTIRISL
jgi:hypothetical protein